MTTAIERQAALEKAVDYKDGWGRSGFELQLAADCIDHVRRLARAYGLSGGDWEATGPTRELHDLATRIEEASA